MLRLFAKLIFVWLIVVSWPGSSAASQGSPETVGPLDRGQFQQELTRLEAVCRRLGLKAEAEICRQWYQAQRPDQQRFYLPVDFPVVPTSSDAAKWREHFISARKRYAIHLFEQATRLADEGDEAAAYRLLWQVLREDPQHLLAQGILGPLATALSTRPQKRTVANSAEFSAVGPVQRWQSRHFVVLSRVPAAESQRLALELEQFYAVWTQCFYELWAPPGVLKTRMSKENTAWPEPKRMEVILLANREEYLRALGLAESKISISVGYYSPQIQRSFFYSAVGNRETVFHELTHQLFAQASLFAGSSRLSSRNSGSDRLSHGQQSGSSPKPADAPEPFRLDQVPGAWCIEGIAMYMESLQPTSEGWTLGGIDAPRIQTSRYRALRDHYWPAWTPYHQATIAEWKEADDIALSYSHAAGMTHLFLDLHPDRISARQAYLRYLTGVYTGAADPDDLLKALGDDEPAAQMKYRELLTVDDQQLENLVPNSHNITQLVLSRSQLNHWQILSSFGQLNWLDLSFTNLPTEQLDWLSELKELQRLSVEGTQFHAEGLRIVAKLPKLIELDLSLCKIDDTALESLAGHPNLEVLWLNQTLITEKALETLESLPKLRQCDISDTRISQESWQEFTAKHQRLGSSTVTPMQ